MRVRAFGTGGGPWRFSIEAIKARWSDCGEAARG
jgi:hypothetical protein